MDTINQDYWYNQWHLDFELHKKMCIKNISKIGEKETVSVYADTDSIFVSYDPAIKNSEWRNLPLSKIDSLQKSFVILEKRQETITTNSNCLGIFREVSDFINFLKDNSPDILIIDGFFVKDYELNSKENSEILSNNKIF